MAEESKQEEVEDNGGTTNETPEFTVKVLDEGESNDTPQNEEKPAEDKEITPPVEKPAEEPEEEYDIVEIDDEIAFNHLKQSKGFEAESFDDLVKPKESKKLTPEVEKFLEFTEKTGNTNFNDFLATQKEWDKEDPDTVLKQILKIENPTLGNKEIDFLFKKKYSYDAEFAEEDEVMEKDINKKVDLQKGLALLEKQKQEYMVERGSDDNIPEEYKTAKSLVDQLNVEISNNEQIATQKRNEFVSATESLFSNNFEGFKTKIGDEEFVIKPSDIAKTKETQLDIRNVQAKFFDADEKLIDPQGYHKAIYFANNPDEVAKHYFNLGKASMTEEEEKRSKNIPEINGIKQVDRPAGDKQFTVKVVE